MCDLGCNLQARTVVRAMRTILTGEVKCGIEPKDCN